MAAVFDFVALGLDIAGLCKSDLGHHRSEELVYENTEKNDVADYRAVIAEIGCCGETHTQSNAGLREEGDAEILIYGSGAAHCPGGETCADVLAEAACDYVNHADDYHKIIGEHVELQLSAAENKEEGEKGSGPAVGLFHKLIGKGTGVAENGAQHHTDEEGGEANGDRADFKLEGGEGNSENNEADDKGHTVSVGMEEFFDGVKNITHNSAENERADNLDHRLNDDGDNIHSAHEEGAGNAESNCEADETHSIVKGDDGEKNIGDGTLCLVLADDHQCCGGSGGACDSAEGDGGREGEGLGESKVKTDHGSLNEDNGANAFADGHNNSLLAGFFELAEGELIADGKGYEAQGKVAYHTEGMDGLVAGEAEAFNAKSAKKERTDKNTGNQIGCDIGEFEHIHNAGHQKTCDKSNRDGEQYCHIYTFLNFIFPSIEYTTFFSNIQEEK